MKNLKVAFLHNIVAPYRHHLFEKLSEVVDLTVYYCSVNPRMRKWDLWPRNYDYKYKILPRVPIGEHSINPSIIKEIVLNKFHLLILGGYIDPTSQILFTLGLILKIPIIYWTEGVKEPRSILGTILRPFRMMFIKKSSAIVVPGRLSRDYVLRMGANKEKVFIAPNTIDNELFINISQKYSSHKKKPKNQLGFGNKIIILYVGHLIKRKGIEYLLRAYAKIKSEHDQVALILLGNGPLEPYLKKLATSLRLQDCKFIHSGLSLEELIKLYSSADVFVLPTLEDVWGFVINEAMVCGLPIIATQASQAAVEMIRPGKNGYIVKEANSEELYHVLKNLINNPNLRIKMGKKSRKIVEHKFAPSHMVEGFLSAIKYSK